MKKLLASFLIILVILIFPFISCNSSSDVENNEKKDIINNDNLALAIPKKLIVVGDSIPVFVDSDMKEQKFLLKSGDECQILKKGSFKTVQGIQDFWYEIKFNNKTGWIFGAFSSLKQNSDFLVFLREFKKNKIDTLSRKHSIDFLYGRPGFKPIKYKRLDLDYYAALFYSDILHPDVELLVIIYELGKPIMEYSLFKGDISNCSLPEAVFTGHNFIKLTGPSCGNNVMPIKYFQILDNHSIKETKSSIISTSSNDLIPAIRNELKLIDASVTNECECTVHSTVKESYAKENFIFYTVIREECKTFCVSSNSTFLALPDNDRWMIKFEEPGGFKAIYESGIDGKYIVVLEEYIQNHILERIEKEKLYLFDPLLKTLIELNIKSESCYILSPEQYGCQFCEKYTAHGEELIIEGNPVKRVIKKITNLYYDEYNSCTLIKQDTQVQNYDWLPAKMKFVLK